MGKTIATNDKITLGDMLAVIEREQAFLLVTKEYNKNGVVLANERVKIYMKDADGVPVEFTASIYVQRAAMNDDERAEIARVSGERDAKATAKKNDETERLAREKRAAFELGQESTMHAIRNIGALAQGAAVLQKLST